MEEALAEEALGELHRLLREGLWEGLGRSLPLESCAPATLHMDRPATDGWGSSHPQACTHATSTRLWCQKGEHIRLPFLEAMKAGVSPQSFGVSTSAPNTMRAFAISTLSLCWTWRGKGCNSSGKWTETDPCSSANSVGYSAARGGTLGLPCSPSAV